MELNKILLTPNERMEIWQDYSACCKKARLTTIEDNYEELKEHKVCLKLLKVLEDEQLIIHGRRSDKKIRELKHDLGGE